MYFATLCPNLLFRYVFIETFPKDFDICGENAEYHSFVFDGPIFREPINYSLHDSKKIDNYSYLIFK